MRQSTLSHLPNSCCHQIGHCQCNDQCLPKLYVVATSTDISYEKKGDQRYVRVYDMTNGGIQVSLTGVDPIGGETSRDRWEVDCRDAVSAVPQRIPNRQRHSYGEGTVGTVSPDHHGVHRQTRPILCMNQDDRPKSEGHQRRSGSELCAGSRGNGGRAL